LQQVSKNFRQKMENKLFAHFVVGFLFFMGIAFAGLSLPEFISSIKLKSSGSITEGTVSKVYNLSNTDMDGVGFSVSYVVNNIKYEVDSKVLSIDTLYKPGVKLGVLYDAQTPEYSKILTYRELYGAWIFYFLLGSSIVLLSFFFRKKILQKIISAGFGS
jgi:hypothetical protein